MRDSPRSISRSPRTNRGDIGFKHNDDRRISGSSRANHFDTKTRKASTHNNQSQRASSSSSDSRAVAAVEDDRARSGAVSSNPEEEYGPKPASPKRSLMSTTGGREEELLIDKLDRKGKRPMSLPYDVRRGHVTEPSSIDQSFNEHSVREDVRSVEVSVYTGRSAFGRAEAAEASKSLYFDETGENEEKSTVSSSIDPPMEPTHGRQSILKLSKPVRNALSLAQAHLSKANQGATSRSLSAAVASSKDEKREQWKHSPKPNLPSRMTGPERMDSQPIVVASSEMTASPSAPNPLDTSISLPNDESPGNLRRAVGSSAVPTTETQQIWRSTNEFDSDDTTLRGSSSSFVRSRLLQRLEAEKDLHRAGLDTSLDAPAIGKTEQVQLEAVEANLRMKARVRLRLAVERQRNSISGAGIEKEQRVDTPNIADGPEHEIGIALSKEDQLKAALAKRRSTR